MKHIKLALPILAFVVLLLSVGVQLIAHFSEPEEYQHTLPPLAEAIPTGFPGWQTEDLDIGPTESVADASLRLLNLDDWVHRAYTGPRGTFSVYVAYWGPGKMPIRLVSQHTPDRCWTENGWSCTDRRFNVEKTVNGHRIQPAQWGEYTINDYVNQSYFWHVVNGEVKWYAGENMNTRTTIKSVFLDIRNFTFGKKPVQYFVRIVSQESLDELWELPEFQQVMADLGELCLYYPEEDAA